MRIATIRERLREHGAKPEHEMRVLRAWMWARPLDSGARRRPAQEYLPLALREDLPSLADDLGGLVRVQSEHPAADGSVHYPAGDKLCFSGLG